MLSDRGVSLVAFGMAGCWMPHPSLALILGVVAERIVLDTAPPPDIGWTALPGTAPKMSAKLRWGIQQPAMLALSHSYGANGHGATRDAAKRDMATEGCFSPSLPAQAEPCADKLGYKRSPGLRRDRS